MDESFPKNRLLKLKLIQDQAEGREQEITAVCSLHAVFLLLKLRADQ